MVFTRQTIVSILILCTAAGGAKAAEGGSSVYLLGVKGPGAGLTPPPGIYFSDQLYFYDAKISADIQLSNGQISAGAKAASIIDIPTALWVTPAEILGGNLGFSATVPFGYLDIDANIAGLQFGDDVFTVGDPSVGAFLGWHADNFHFQAGVTGFLPIGDYQKGQIANIAKHRLAADLYGALTWRNPSISLDISNVVGLTFNAENEATNYKTGTEFHWEWAVTKSFSPAFSAGLVGYYYKQLTGDSGSGAALGSFKGEVAAIGATVGYNFLLDKIPVSTQARFYHEFAATNRLEGNAIFLQASFPLSAP